MRPFASCKRPGLHAPGQHAARGPCPGKARDLHAPACMRHPQASEANMRMMGPLKQIEAQTSKSIISDGWSDVNRRQLFGYTAVQETGPVEGYGLVKRAECAAGCGVLCVIMLSDATTSLGFPVQLATSVEVCAAVDPEDGHTSTYTYTRRP